MRSLLLAGLAACLLASTARAESKPVAIGAKVANLAFKDTRFQNRSLDDFKDRKAFVIVFVDTGCPLVKRYLPVLNRMEAEYRKQGVQFLAVNVGVDETILSLAALAIEHGSPFPFVKDTDGNCLDALGAERTPEVVVLDAQRTIRYRGRIDDQYRVGGNLPAATKNELKDAIDDVMAGKPVRTPTTTVDGCKIARPVAAKEAKQVTYAEHIGPMLLKNCAVCHKPNETAPFPLLTYENAMAKAKAIAEVTTTGQMPPWYAAPEHGKFSNARALTVSDREMVRQWVRDGMPKGDEAVVAKLPKVEPREGEWRIGKPDLILTTQTFDLPAEGDIAYKYVVLPDVFLKETWVTQIQILPDNTKAVHHANLFYVAAGQKNDMKNFLTGVVPGAEPMELPKGVAVKLPAASVLALQIHFVSSGKPEKCSIRVGLKYASGEVNQQLRFHLFDGGRFSIPAGEPAQALKRTTTLDRNIVGVGMFTHMHLRGKAMTFTAEPPGGKAETLLMVPNYHFDWQVQYVYPLGEKKLPKGTKLECVALYDNSDFNPFNPDPKAVVRSGDQTYNEMMNGFFFYVDADEKLKLEVDGKTGRAKK